MISGRNPILLNCRYFYQISNENNPRPEHFQVLWKDDNGVKHVTEESPNVDFWIVKPKYRNYTYNHSFEDMAKMDKVTVPYSQIRYRIAKEAGEWGKSIVSQATQMGNRQHLDELYRWPYAFGADFQPEFYYMKQWFDKYPLVLPHLTKAFLDIEVDQIDINVTPNQPELAYAPINLITIHLEETSESFTFVLKPYMPIRRGQSDKEWEKRLQLYYKQKRDHEWLMSHKEEFYKRCQKEFEPVYGKIRYVVREYEREIDLISDAFALIHARQPDFCMIWNMRFDIPYILGRIQILGYNPEDILCHKSIKYKECIFLRDNSTHDMKKQMDIFRCSSFTQYICQLRMYRNIRKGQHELRSGKLNDVMDEVLKDHKVDYPPETNIRTFAYTDWVRFIMYNKKDTLGQFGIERCVNDLRTWYNRSMSNLTPFAKMFREIHLLRNVREKDFELQGKVQGNNINILNLRLKGKKNLEDEDDDEESTYKGAIVANPLMNARVGNLIMGKPSNLIFRHVIDFDMRSFYPSIKIAFNIEGETMIYKASFINGEFVDGRFINRSLNQTYSEKNKYGKVVDVDFTGEAINSYVTKNYLTFAFNWINAPSIVELEELLKVA